MASTVKVAIAALYLSQVDHGQKTLDDTISGVPVRKLMNQMLIYSDNRAADVLFKDVGGPTAVHHWLSQNGIQGVRVDRTIAQLLAAKRDLWDTRDSSTPKAMVELLRRIYRGELISSQSRNYLLGVMAKCHTGRNRMKSMLPAGTPVEHKTGTLNGLADDVGFISMPDGHRIAVAIFTRGGSDRPRTIAQAARTIYDGFKTLFSWPFRPALTAQ
jgi:beta-lactamase class A